MLTFSEGSLDNMVPFMVPTPIDHQFWDGHSFCLLDRGRGNRALRTGPEGPVVFVFDLLVGYIMLPMDVNYSAIRLRSQSAHTWKFVQI